MSGSLLIYVFALVLLIVSFVLAVIRTELSATLFAIWAIAVIVIFTGFPGVVK